MEQTDEPLAANKLQAEILEKQAEFGMQELTEELDSSKLEDKTTRAKETSETKTETARERSQLKQT